MDPPPKHRPRRVVYFKPRDIRRLNEMFGPLELNFSEQVRRAIEAAWVSQRAERARLSRTMPV